MPCVHPNLAHRIEVEIVCRLKRIEDGQALPSGMLEFATEHQLLPTHVVGIEDRRLG